MGYNETPTEKDKPMFDLKNLKKPNNLQAAIDKASAELLEIPTNSEDYVRNLDHLSKLVKLKEANSPKPASRDTWIQAAASVLGVVAILSYESRDQIIRSKALGFVKFK
jgi:hypothetical protein